MDAGGKESGNMIWSGRVKRYAMESIEREKGERYEINFISKLKKFATYQI